MKNLAKLAYLMPVFLVFTTSFYGLSYAENFDPLGGLSGGSGGSPNPDPQVYDLDALTEGAGEKDEVKPEEEKPEAVKPDQVKSGDDATANGENSSEDEFSLSIAECLIMEQLGIEDKKCDKVKQAFKCPDYTTCINYCGKQLDICFAQAAKGEKGVSDNACRSHYNNECLFQCAQLYKECGAKYPPEKLQLPQSGFELLDASGDVRVTYEDNPTPAGMKAIVKDVDELVGATIFTGEKSGVTLRFSDGSTAYVGQNAYFRIDDFYTSDKLEKAKVFLKNGQVKVMVNQFKDDDKKYAYVVMTPLWKVEVKGTELLITVNEDGSAKVETLSGEVEVYDYDDKLLASVAAGEEYSSSPSKFADPSSLQLSDDPVYSYEDFVSDQNMKKWVYGFGALGAVILVGAFGFYLKRRS